MTNPEVEIVLPCHDAAAWIDSFINHLLTLELPPWRLVARDDGSADTSLSILRHWRDRLGESMLLVEAAGRENLGVTGNYSAVLTATTAKWVLTADPDDVWLPARVPITLGALREAERMSGSDTPIAVGTDAVVVDENLGFVAPSYWRWSHIPFKTKASLRSLAMDSPALGSTMAINRALINAALPIPADAVYQDWWLSMVATAFGRLITRPEITILYRRHGQSVTKNPLATSLSEAVTSIIKSPVIARQRVDFLIRQAGRQAAAFLRTYENRLSAKDINALRTLTRLPSMNPIARRAAVVRHRLWFRSWMKNAGLLAFL